MPYALCLIVLGILVDESTRVDIQIKNTSHWSL